MNLTVAIKKNDGQYEAALVHENKFTRSATSKSITDLFTKLAGPLLAAPQEDGAEVAITVNVLTKAEVDREDRRNARARETAAADQEAKELEALNAAQLREMKALADKPREDANESDEASV